MFQKRMNNSCMRWEWSAECWTEHVTEVSTYIRQCFFSRSETPESPEQPELICPGRKAPSYGLQLMQFTYHIMDIMNRDWTHQSNWICAGCRVRNAEWTLHNNVYSGAFTVLLVDKYFDDSTYMCYFIFQRLVDS